MRLRDPFSVNALERKHLFTFLRSFLWTFYWNCPPNMKVKKILTQQQRGLYFAQWMKKAVRLNWLGSGPSIAKNRTVKSHCSVSGEDKLNPALWLATREGKTVPSCCSGLATRYVPQGKILRKPYNKFFIDQAFSFKMASFFFCEFMDLDSLLVHKQSKHANKELGQYPAILNEKAWSITHGHI